MKYHYDRTPIGTIVDALSYYTSGEFESPTRSTVPLLSWLNQEQPMVSSLSLELGMPTDPNLCLEYQVKPPKGRGTASHTDLMVISGESSLAVEAKWTEPRYERVSTWLKNKGTNGQIVLTGWLGLLQKHTQFTLNLADFSDAIYQMVHRAASACAVGSDPRMAYLVFKSSSAPRTVNSEQTQSDLLYLFKLFGCPSAFPFFLVEIPLSPTAAFEAIENLLKANKATAQRVTTALAGSAPLFKFGGYRVTKIGDNP